MMAPLLMGHYLRNTVTSPVVEKGRHVRIVDETSSEEPSMIPGIGILSDCVYLFVRGGVCGCGDNPKYWLRIDSSI